MKIEFDGERGLLTIDAPDADVLDEYLCFVTDDGEPMGWDSLEWNGSDFLLDSRIVVTRDVTHWMPKPPDPPAQTARPS